MIHGIIIIAITLGLGIYADKRYGSRITSLEAAVTTLIEQAKTKL